MGLSIYNIKKWGKMFAGKSVLHVNQSMGRAFECNMIKGYFNDLTQKVLMQPQFVESDKLPTVKTEQGEEILFPVTIFQYALGCWDLYLLQKDDKYKEKFLSCAKWTIEMQESTGAWNNFFFVYPEHPYGAMAQGEATSLLVRAWILTQEEEYLIAARRATDFMLRPIEEGGTALYVDDGLILLEYTHLSAVFNGWVFSLFGLYDIYLATGEEQYKNTLKKTIATLEAYISCFDRRYWSNYDLNNHIASPFYHHLHIAQLEALSIITGSETFKSYYAKWYVEENSRIRKLLATVVKGFQKISE